MNAITTQPQWDAFYARMSVAFKAQAKYYRALADAFRAHPLQAYRDVADDYDKMATDTLKRADAILNEGDRP